jgi:hypothetical protein
MSAASREGSHGSDRGREREARTSGKSSSVATRGWHVLKDSWARVVDLAGPASAASESGGERERVELTARWRC